MSACQSGEAPLVVFGRSRSSVRARFSRLLYSVSFVVPLGVCFLTSACEDRLLIYGNVILSGAGEKPALASAPRSNLFPLPRRVNGTLCFRRLFIAALSRRPLLLLPVISDIKEIVSMRARVSFCKVYSPPCCRRAVLSSCSSGCERIRNEDSHKMFASARGLGARVRCLPACSGRAAAVSNRCPADLRLCLLFLSRLFAGLSLWRCSLERVSIARGRRVLPSAVMCGSLGGYRFLEQPRYSARSALYPPMEGEKQTVYHMALWKHWRRLAKAPAGKSH